jgi:hypothetical protein
LTEKKRLQTPHVDEEKMQRVMRLEFNGRAHMPSWVMAKLFSQLPDDSVVLWGMQDYASHNWSIVICSSTFKKIQEGAVLPRMEVKVNGVSGEVELIYPLTEANFGDALLDL